MLKNKTLLGGSEKHVGLTALSKKDQVCSAVIEYGILALIVLSPLPAASVYEWSILAVQLLVLAMLASYVLMSEKPRPNPLLSKSLKWPKIFFLGFFVLVIIQILPLSASIVRFLSHGSIDFQSQYNSVFESMSYFSISLIPSHSFREGMILITYFVLGFLIVRTVTEWRQIKRIIAVLISMGVFQAAYGLFELYRRNPRILFYEKVYNLDSASGTFINRNHFSGYLEMLIPIAIGLVISRFFIFSQSELNWREKVQKLSDRDVSSKFLIIAGILLMSIAILFSKSRSGIFILIFGFFLFFGMTSLFIRKNGFSSKRVRLFLISFFLILVFIALRLGINSALERFSMDDLLSESRPLFWANTVELFSDFPIFGTGLGTFPALYPDWEAKGNIIRLFHAHNDFLEYLAEIGLVGFALLFGGILLILVQIFLCWRNRRHPEVKGLALGGLIALISILVHSVTDFNLHIPANIILFTIVISLTAVIAFYKYDPSA
ncbi:O-antigen ligase family protein [Acidobacteriota bacterium]